MSARQQLDDPVVRTRKRSAVFVDQATKRRLEVEIEDTPFDTTAVNGASGGSDPRDYHDRNEKYNHSNDKVPSADDGMCIGKHGVSKEADVHAPATDIVYDETQPKRLNNPRRPRQGSISQGPHVLQESIGFLISPDDPDEGSPKRRSRRREAFRYDDDNHCPRIEITDDSTDTANKAENTEKTDIEGPVVRPKVYSEKPSPEVHYERSPKMQRKISSSPVHRMMNKCGPPSVAHGTKRKISSHARIESSTDRIQLAVPPKRKISLDARLEASRNKNTLSPEPVTIESLRKRKVSFDTTALINGNAVIPLNDEVRGPMPQCDEESRDSADEITNDVDSEDKEVETSQPRFYVTQESDPVFEESDLSSEGSELTDDRDAQMSEYHNKGYVPDDEEIQSVSSGTPPPAYGDCETTELEKNTVHTTQQSNLKPYQPIKRVDDTTPSPRRTITNEDRLHQKLSACSMGSLRSLDGGTPKSILKTRREDTESVGSVDSSALKKFHVRKDSIALFSDQHGDISALQQSAMGSNSSWSCISTSQFKQAWQNRNHLFQNYKLHFLVLFLFSMTVAFVVIGLHFHSVHKKQLAIAQRVFFDAKQRTFFLHDPSEKDTFTGRIGQNLPAWMLPSHCYQNYASISDRTCLRWKGHAQLDIGHFNQNDTNCYNITWHLEKYTLLYDCFDVGKGFWYGPVNSSESKWPINSIKSSFNIGDVKHHDSGSFSSALEYYWLSSNGDAIVLDQDLPLILDWNKKQKNRLCFIEPEMSNGFYHSRPSALNARKYHYTVCSSDSIMNTHRMVRQRFMAPLSELPVKQMLEYPHWSSVWDSDTYVINDTVIENLAVTLKKRNLPCSTIEIDGKWEYSYGDLAFNKQFFENLTNVNLHVAAAGCELSLSVSPFFSHVSKHFAEGFAKGYFVKAIGKDAPALIKWENGIGAMVDVSNDNAKEWIENMLRQMSEKYKIEHFRFRYGNKAWVPYGPVFQSDNVDPSDVKSMFTGLISSIGNAVFQSTADSQHIASLIELPTSFISKGDTQCIKNIIPEVLNLGIMGYPFVMVSGLREDTKFQANVDTMPSRELFIRWMQLATMMPAMKFTVKPWTYDEEIVSAARNLSKTHLKLVIPAIFNSDGNVLGGMPVIKPIWMDYSADRMTYKLDDQFLLGSQYLVAPVMCEGKLERGAAERDIYIPAGVWKDITSEKVVLGPKWIIKYRVYQYDIPIFEKLTEYNKQ